MKINQLTLAIGTILAISATSTSCTTSSISKNDTGTISSTDVLFSVKKASRNYVTTGGDALSDDSTHIYSTIQVEIQWPVKYGNHDISILQDSLQALSLGTTKGTIDQAMANMLDNPVGHNYYTLEPIDSIDTNASTMTLYQAIYTAVASFNDRYIVYGVTRSVYEGGAHGLTTTSYLTWLPDSQITLSLKNAFKPDSDRILLDAIKTHLAEQNNAVDIEALDKSGYFTDNIYISPNFYIDGYDIVFHYNPYDIAAYSVGSIDVRVPYYTVADIISPTLLQVFESGSI